MAMPTTKHFHNGKPQPRAGLTRAQRHTFRAAKPLKNQLLLIERDALALIRHADGDLRTLGEPPLNRATRFGIFDGIANQIFEMP